MVKRTASIEEVLAAVEAARDKVMADEVKSLTKLGIPKAMAYQMIASRFHQKVGNQEEALPRLCRGDPKGTPSESHKVRRRLAGDVLSVGRSKSGLELSLALIGLL